MRSVRRGHGADTGGGGAAAGFGLFHANRSNAFCLADDLMEPLRPLVDRRAPRQLHDQGCREVTPEAKKGLLGLGLADPVRMGHANGARRRSTVNLTPHGRLLGGGRHQGEIHRLEIPQAWTRPPVPPR